MKVLGVIMGVLLLGACGSTPPRTGVLVNRIGAVKTRLGPSPIDLPGRPYASAPGFLRRRQGDVQGDEAVEVLVELAGGHGIEIRDQSGSRLAQIITREYVTDFGAVQGPKSEKQHIVLYTYPNRTNTGTFTVITADQREVASWDEDPPPAAFSVGTWNGDAALFYLQRDVLVIRSPDGQPLSRLAAPDGGHFRSVFVAAIGEGRTAALASGNGYTPYHAVYVYDADGQVVFQEIDNEHAFDLQAGPDEGTFLVTTRSNQWRYATGTGTAR